MKILITEEQHKQLIVEIGEFAVDPSIEVMDLDKTSDRYSSVFHYGGNYFYTTGDYDINSKAISISFGLYDEHKNQVSHTVMVNDFGSLFKRLGVIINECRKMWDYFNRIHKGDLYGFYYSPTSDGRDRLYTMIFNKVGSMFQRYSCEDNVFYLTDVTEWKQDMVDTYEWASDPENNAWELGYDADAIYYNVCLDK